uniref:Zinc finger and BTB domain-containing protein 20 n=1 Tax=Schistocephalus solidus TaxID=70667 RepID=A0A0X3PS65_SCHSO
MESSNVQTQAHLSHSNESPSAISKTYLESEDDNQLSLCCLCGKTFPTISSLHYHIDSEHDDANDDADSASTAGPSSSASDHCLSPAKPISKRVFPITSLEDYRSGSCVPPPAPPPLTKFM